MIARLQLSMEKLRLLGTPRIRLNQLTAREWIERATETLDKRTREADDMELIDAHDDLCTALEVLKLDRERSILYFLIGSLLVMWGAF